MVKPPYIDVSLTYKMTYRSPDFNTLDDSKPFALMPKTTKRSVTIIENYVNKYVKIHTGFRFRRLSIHPSLVGYKLGQFVFTKKLGKSIHDSKRNAKKRAKMRRKITQKKARKTSAGKKAVVKKKKKK
jgi:ribosomal protein S19